jgi:putative addiction module CopG family antidote
MPRTTSYVLSDAQSAFIDDQLASGACKSASEFVREAIDERIEEARKSAWLDAALEEGERSGIAPGTHEEVWARVYAKIDAWKKEHA